MFYLWIEEITTNTKVKNSERNVRSVSDMAPVFRFITINHPRDLYQIAISGRRLLDHERRQLDELCRDTDVSVRCVFTD